MNNPIKASDLKAQVQAEVEEGIMPKIWEIIHEHRHDIVSAYGATISDTSTIKDLELNRQRILFIQSSLAQYGYDFRYENDQRDGEYIKISILVPRDNQ